MKARICLSAEEAFAAGFEEPCEHRVPSPADCPDCRLTAAEISRLSVLLRDAHLAAERPSAAAA